MKATFLFLGTGGSLGVPIVGCTCRICKSLSPFNHRFRPAGLLKVADKSFLIDVGPDFRDQALKFGIEDFDGVLITHGHYDHVGGIDDLRAIHLLQRKMIPILSSKETYSEISHRFHYLFRSKEGKTLPFDFTLLEEDFGQVDFLGLKVGYVSYFQAGMKVTGYRFGRFAYISDILKYDDQIINGLKGVDTLVLSALRYTTSEVHFTIDQAIEFSKKVGARRTFLTHLAHDIDHEETNEKLPEEIRLAYDGLELELKL